MRAVDHSTHVREERLDPVPIGGADSSQPIAHGHVERHLVVAHLSIAVLRIGCRRWKQTSGCRAGSIGGSGKAGRWTAVPVATAMVSVSPTETCPTSDTQQHRTRNNLHTQVKNSIGTAQLQLVDQLAVERILQIRQTLANLPVMVMHTATLTATAASSLFLERGRALATRACKKLPGPATASSGGMSTGHYDEQVRRDKRESQHLTRKYYSTQLTTAIGQLLTRAQQHLWHHGVRSPTNLSRY